MSHRRIAGGVGVLAAVALALGARLGVGAHLISPPVAVTGVSQVFTLAVPTEKEAATTTGIEFTRPAGFWIDPFEPSPGWKRQPVQPGQGDDAVVSR